MRDMIVMSDSLFSGRKGWGVHLQRIRDGCDTFHTCLCVASGCSLMKWWDGNKCPDSAISMAARAIGRNPVLKRRLRHDPVVRITVLNAAGSIAQCRESGEQYPRLVAARRRVPHVDKLQTPWTICDLEDVVQQRPHRRHFADLEACKLRDRQGFYDDRDPEHLRARIARRGQDELLKAIRRTALRRHGRTADNELLLVIAAGWNVADDHFSSLDKKGKAWFRAEMTAAAELCALDGHRLSSIQSKLEALAKRRRGKHTSFLKQSLRSTRGLPASRMRRSKDEQSHPSRKRRWSYGSIRREKRRCLVSTPKN